MTVANVQAAMDRASADLRARLDVAPTDVAKRLAMSIYEAEMRTLVHMVIVDLRNEHTDKMIEFSDVWAKRCATIAKEAIATVTTIRDR